MLQMTNIITKILPVHSELCISCLSEVREAGRPKALTKRNRDILVFFFLLLSNGGERQEKQNRNEESAQFFKS